MAELYPDRTKSVVDSTRREPKAISTPRCPREEMIMYCMQSIVQISVLRTKDAQNDDELMKASKYQETGANWLWVQNGKLGN